MPCLCKSPKKSKAHQTLNEPTVHKKTIHTKCSHKTHCVYYTLYSTCTHYTQCKSSYMKNAMHPHCMAGIAFWYLLCQLISNTTTTIQYHQSLQYYWALFYWMWNVHFIPQNMQLFCTFLIISNITTTIQYHMSLQYNWALFHLNVQLFQKIYNHFVLLQ